MGRKGKRRRLDTGIYADGSGISVCVGAFPEKRFGLGTPLVLLRQVRNELLKRHQSQKTTGPSTLTRDCARYRKRKEHLVNMYSVDAEIAAWTARYGDRPRHALTRDDVLDARTAWLEQGLAPKTINNRVDRLRAIFRELDGPQAWSPTDGIRKLSVPRTPIQRITPQLVLSVIARMRASTFQKRMAKPIARLMVLATTGRRPSEIARAQASDVDFDNRVWVPRDGKNGFTPGIYLNDDMLAAWRAFDAANAWGRFNSRVFPRTLQRYGWPKGVRPYNLRHTVGITLSEGGFDLADIGPQLGHKKAETTRKHYVPVLNSKMQRMSEFLDGRFGFGVPGNRSINPLESGPRPSEDVRPQKRTVRGKNGG